MLYFAMAFKQVHFDSFLTPSTSPISMYTSPENNRVDSKSVVAEGLIFTAGLSNMEFDSQPLPFYYMVWQNLRLTTMLYPSEVVTSRFEISNQMYWTRKHFCNITHIGEARCTCQQNVNCDLTPHSLTCTTDPVFSEIKGPCPYTVSCPEPLIHPQRFQNLFYNHKYGENYWDENKTENKLPVQMNWACVLVMEGDKKKDKQAFC